MAKRCRTQQLLDGDCGDYISKLPESVIGHILSRLSTEEAVKTCVLSKDWELKWTNIYNLTLEDSPLRVKNRSIFEDFMDRISRVSLSHHVKHFSLLCGRMYDTTRMTAWVSPILGPKLETFTLVCPSQKGFIIPQGFLTCTSLKHLFILSDCTFRVPTQHTFPNLRKISLYQVWISNVNSGADTMVLQFPVLKELCMYESKWLNLKLVEIHAPLLDRFVCQIMFRDVHGCSIKFVGATIGFFNIYGHVRDSFVLSGSTVAEAYLYCFPGVSKLQLQKLLKELSISSMSQLSLNGSTVKVYEQLDLQHTRYNKLEEIQISNGANLNGLLKLLHTAPNLKFLAVPVDDKDLDHIDYNDVESVPYCISSSLEKVKFAYTSFTPKTQSCLEMFILKFGARLKKVLFTIDDASRQNEIFTRLSTLHMASPNVEITVDGMV